MMFTSTRHGEEECLIPALVKDERVYCFGMVLHGSPRSDTPSVQGRTLLRGRLCSSVAEWQNDMNRTDISDHLEESTLTPDISVLR